jgi:ribosomal protein L37AE/L43A
MKPKFKTEYEYRKNCPHCGSSAVHMMKMRYPETFWYCDCCWMKWRETPLDHGGTFCWHVDTLGKILSMRERDRYLGSDEYQSRFEEALRRRYGSTDR